MDYRESMFWDKQLERGFPDCRLSFSNREKRQVRLGRMEMDVVFCVQCAIAKGLVPVHCPHVYFICDDCFYGKMNGQTPPGSVMVPTA